MAGGFAAYTCPDASYLHRINFGKSYYLREADEGKVVSQTDTTVSNASSDISASTLPALYPNLKWEIPKSKTLTFTSGKRKTEQEVIYMSPEDYRRFALATFEQERALVEAIMKRQGK